MLISSALPGFNASYGMTGREPAGARERPADPAATRESGQKPEGAPASASSAQGRTSTEALSQEDLAQIQQLKARDQEVRQHEQAHLNAAGGLAVSGASYTYQKGPDGVNYAIGGEVRIDVSPGSTPAETISKAQRIRAAALAPAEPSGQDRAVAAKAGQMEQQARTELALERLIAQQGASAESGGPREGDRGQRVSQFYRQAEAFAETSRSVSVFA